MVGTRAAGTLLIPLGLAAFTLAGCGGESGKPTEDTPVRCADGLDNDGDSYVDCDDQDCLRLEVCAGDGDADGDGDTDADGDGDTDADGDGDGDGDTDADADGDGDTDADADGDGDADSDADGDCDPSWSSETVDDTVNAALGSGLAIDSDGGAHLAYGDPTRSNLWYATNVGGDWAIETVVEDQNNIIFAAIATESSGVIDIAYQNSQSQARLARGTAGGWSFPWWDQSGGQGLGVVVDASDAVSIAYSGHYATNATGEWLSELVPTGGVNTIALTVADDGTPHLVYTLGGGTNTLHYATRAAGEWTTEDVETDAVYGFRLRIGLTPEGVPRIIYGDLDEMELRDATRGDAGWEVVPIDTGAAAPTGASSFVLDGDGAAHVIFSDEDGVAYATDRSGGWVVEPISFGGFIGTIALGAEGTVHVAWVGGMDGHVHYASRSCH